MNASTELQAATAELTTAAKGLRNAHRRGARTVDAWAERYEVALERHEAAEAAVRTELAELRARLMRIAG